MQWFLQFRLGSHDQFFLAVLLGARLLPGLLGCGHIVVLWLL